VPGRPRDLPGSIGTVEAGALRLADPLKIKFAFMGEAPDNSDNRYFMPAVSKAQQRLMAAAEHGADFPLARDLRASMTHGQLHDFASGSMKGKPAHAKAKGKGQHPHSNLGKFLHPKKKGR